MTDSKKQMIRIVIGIEKQRADQMLLDYAALIKRIHEMEKSLIDKPTLRKPIGDGWGDEFYESHVEFFY